jgi:hypothetical protein
MGTYLCNWNNSELCGPFIFIQELFIILEVDTAASILHGVKIVQIHNITKKPAKIYVLSLYNLDAM